MRTLLIGLVSLTAALSSVPALAHPEDDFGSRYERAPTRTELAQEAVVKLVSQAKLPASWTGALVTSSTSRTKNGVEQFVVKFENNKIKQPAKRFLYVISTADGKFVSANHKLVR